ncbi:hypothetical protein Ddye_015783 [Dipteronia dyeriana]|uniref:Uncharacterized protein n=1 Tax=Dipteronia dyeriana TaxID=168575 RepID=A0AAD9U638_9ROSI|nr:hypothetical protein Ddye_015783 [Dipteronia dyeriana]
MIFIFILPGCERLASDSRVLCTALTRPIGLKVSIRMDVGGISQTNEQERRGVRHVRIEEENVLLSILDKVIVSGGHADCGSFNSGTVKNKETRLAFVVANSGLKANPYIESKLKFWKKQHGVVYDMLNTSGLWWNNATKYIEVDSDD